MIYTKPINVRLDKEQDRKLQALTERLKLPKSQVIRNAIFYTINRWEKKFGKL